jgi:rhamnosyltransferase subunit B
MAGDARGLALLVGLNDLRRRRTRTNRQHVALPAEHPLARLRAAAELSPALEFAPAPVLTLCMWPEWFAAPQPDWPDGAVVAGFPFYPLPKSSAVNRSAGADADAPVVVTTGSVAGSQFEFYERAVAACAALGRPVVLVSPHRNHIPVDLPPHVTWVAHAPFDELFGRAGLVLHHGGIGTASYAIAAGVPQIVMPMRGDQFDNGNRLQRLGVARMLASRGTSVAALRTAIDAMLGSSRVAAACRRCRARVDVQAGLRIAADAFEAKFLQAARGRTKNAARSPSA